MNIQFAKYQGAGNDFVIIDNRDQSIQLTPQQVAFLCDRRFGIGADGLMLLETQHDFDFKMVYFNSDGNESTMCGNGGRCIVAFAHSVFSGEKASFTFNAVDGAHNADVFKDGLVALQMQDVNEINPTPEGFILNTGSPHFIFEKNDLSDVNVFLEGRAIRNREEFLPNGINVNFVQKDTQGLTVYTYERGVEDETFSCGTGVTAAAIASKYGQNGHFDIPIITKGGHLNVSFDIYNNHANNVVLTGPATFVFKGEINI